MNKRESKITASGFLLALLAILLISGAPVKASPEAQANLVQNPSFEGGTYVADSAGDMRVPNSWEAFNLSSARMHYEEERHPSHVHSGSVSARIFSAWENHNAGLRQKVTGLTPGATYRLSAYVFMWSTETPVVDTPSTAFMSGFLGADPTGGKDPSSANVKWTSYRQMDTFVNLTVDVVPSTSEMWIFLRTQTEWPVDRNDAFWDDVSLTMISASGATATTASSQATTAPPAGATSVISTPDSQGRIIHTVASGDTLSGIAYQYGVSMEQIQQLNGMTNTVVLLGQQLIISNGNVEPAATATSAPTEESESGMADTTATPEPTVAAQAVTPGKLCVIGFIDENGNGFREPDENPASNISFSLSDTSVVLTSGTTDAAGSLCFDALDPATYSIAWADQSYKPTTDQTWTATVTSGVTLNHEFGLQTNLETAEEVDEEAASSGGLPRWLVAVIGALGAILLLAGLGAGGYYLLMKKKVS